jgi:tetratricopeptide (TPR) repeat protein
MGAIICFQLLYGVEDWVMRWQDLDLLEEIGLTLYERKALASLMVQGVADAAEKLAAAYPGNTEWQRDLFASYSRAGDVQAQQGDLFGALSSYRNALSIVETLARRDPGNAQWQRDLILSLVKVGTTSGDKSYLQRALDLALALKNSDKLAPADDSMVEELRSMLSQ